VYIRDWKKGDNNNEINGGMISTIKIKYSNELCVISDQEISISFINTYRNSQVSQIRNRQR